MEWRYRLSAALNMTSILSFYPFNKWDKGLDSALSEQHGGVKESAFPKDSSLHLDAVGAPLSSLDSHLFTLAPGWAMFPWRYKIKDDHVAWFRPEATIQNQYSLKGVTFQPGHIWPALC